VTLMVLQSISTAGTPPTFNTVTATDTLPAQVGVTLIVRNTSAAPITVTLITPGNLGTGDAYPDHAVTCGAGTGTGNEVPTEVWLPITPEYVDPSTGLVTVTYSAQTSVKSALVQL
jgi:hypothetical protein